MSTTISGGAYQRPDGSWVNAKGEPLESQQVARFQEVAARRQQDLAAAEQQRLTLEAGSNPIANALMQMLGLRSAAPAQPAPAEVDAPPAPRQQPQDQEPERRQEAQPQRGRQVEPEPKKRG